MNYSTEDVLEVLKRYEEESKPKLMSVSTNRKGSTKTIGKRLTHIREQHSDVNRSEISRAEQSLIVKEYGSENLHKTSN